MKKERNCNMNPYPVYPAYPGMMPMMSQGMMPNQAMMPNSIMPNQINMPTIPSGTMNQNISGIDAQLSALNSQISNLEKRVSRLEGTVGGSSTLTPKYNESNYYIV